MSMEDDWEIEAELEKALDASKPAKLTKEQEQEQEQEPLEKIAGETAAEEQARYVREGRRFVKEPAAKDGVVAKDGAPAEQPAKVWRPTWYKDEYGQWDKLSEPLRNALRDQERNASQAIEKHSVAAKSWDQVGQLLAPHRAELAAAGMSEQQYVSNLVNADKYLRDDPVKAMNWLCQSYLGCDVMQLADWMAENNQQPAAVDPVKQQLAALQHEIQTLKAMPQQQARVAADKQIQDWSKDKPDFATVRPLMAALVKQNPEASLDDLYEQACFAHPETRDRILQQREDKRLSELKRARAAGAQSPRVGSPSGANAQSYKNMTLEEEIAANLG